MKQLFFLSLILIAASCTKKATLPDITSGLVIDIPLDDNIPLEKVTNITGIIDGVTPTYNRKNEANKAMLFNGADSTKIDFGAISNASFPNNEFTISCWVYVTDTSKTLAVLSKRNAFSPFEYSLDNHFNRQGFTLDNWVANGGGTIYGIDPLKASAPVLLNSWHHIVYVADGAELKCYNDGVIQSQTDIKTINTSFSQTAASLIIGNGGAYGKEHYFTGAIDDIKMYNRALSEDDVKELYNQ
jgi:hypothetical protein